MALQAGRRTGRDAKAVEPTRQGSLGTLACQGRRYMCAKRPPRRGQRAAGGLTAEAARAVTGAGMERKQGQAGGRCMVAFLACAPCARRGGGRPSKNSRTGSSPARSWASSGRPVRAGDGWQVVAADRRFRAGSGHPSRAPAICDADAGSTHYGGWMRALLQPSSRCSPGQKPLAHGKFWPAPPESLDRFCTCAAWPRSCSGASWCRPARQVRAHGLRRERLLSQARQDHARQPV